MKVGTKSVLFGAHQFLIHPLFVAWAWFKLYGFPFDPRLWIAFFIHDLGYIGKPNMDGPEGERHPYFAARVMGILFGAKWYNFCLFHSRFLAKKTGQPFSKLCIADKLAMTLEPWWLYLPRTILTGEINEYMQLADTNSSAKKPKYAAMNIQSDSRKQWFRSTQMFLRQWVDQHKNVQHDSWMQEICKRSA